MPRLNQLYPENVQPIDYNALDKFLYSPLDSLIKKNEPLSPRSNDIQNIEQDYIDLFSYVKKGHIGKYMYMYRPHIYEDAIKQEAYYPFRMERDLLFQKANQIGI